MGKNKVLYIAVAIVVVCMIGDSIYWYMQKQNVHPSSSTQNSNAKLKTNTQINTGAQNGSVKTSSTLSYADALKIYNGRRIQFTVNLSNYCSVLPYNVTFKNGANVMLDNRYSKSIVISIGGQPYTLKAYDFKIITLNTSAKLPHDMTVDCGTGKNNGSITLRQ